MTISVQRRVIALYLNSVSAFVRCMFFSNHTLKISGERFFGVTGDFCQWHLWELSSEYKNELRHNKTLHNGRSFDHARCGDSFVCSLKDSDASFGLTSFMRKFSLCNSEIFFTFDIVISAPSPISTAITSAFSWHSSLWNIHREIEIQFLGS